MAPTLFEIYQRNMGHCSEIQDVIITCSLGTNYGWGVGVENPS